MFSPLVCVWDGVGGGGGRARVFVFKVMRKTSNDVL